MYEIIKNVIISGRYELSDMLKKIDTVWLQGDLTDEQKAELASLAQEGADPENSYAPLQEQVKTLFENCEEMAAEILTLKEKVAKLEGEELPPVESEEYPPYKKPQGAHDAYHTNDKITYTDSKKYICIAPEGVAVVWGLDEYPAYWQEVIA